jgi:N-dimethylarginine dimethylaminohydrolase
MCFAMSVPYFISNDHENNAQMVEINRAYGKVDRDKAVEQFNEIYRYCSNVFRIYIVPSLVGLQDQVYVSNLGVTFGAIGAGGPTIILSRFAAEGRAGEELVGESYFRNLGFQTMLSPYPFEGEADLKCIAPSVYVGAVGMRTTCEALRWIEETTTSRIIDCRMTDKYLYHLDCVLFRVTDRDLAVVTSAIERDTLREIEKHINVVDVPYEIGLAGATNCVRAPNELLCDENMLLFADNPTLLDREKKKMKFLEYLAKTNNLNVKLFQTTEFIKSGAALSCMFMRLNWI